tara:strand:+ start:5582 stop:5863 length:282 start_codon:yes stop_codon:yes gene_type:complete
MNVKIGFIISIVYVVFRFFEMKFIEKENKPLKPFFKDGLIVFLSVLLATAALSPNSPLKNLFGGKLPTSIDLGDSEILGNDDSPPVFTNRPNF